MDFPDWRWLLVSLLTQNSQLVLYALMFLVGISVGLNKDVLRRIRSYQLRVLVIPAGVVAGSLAGGLVCRPDYRAACQSGNRHCPAVWAGTVFPASCSLKWPELTWAALPF